MTIKTIVIYIINIESLVALGSSPTVNFENYSQKILIIVKAKRLFVEKCIKIL